MPRPAKRQRPPPPTPPGSDDEAPRTPPASEEGGISYEEGVDYIESVAEDYLARMREKWKALWEYTEGNLDPEDLDEVMNDVFTQRSCSFVGRT